MYKPLPDSVTIKKSGIHGLGLYCIKPLQKGIDLGLSHFYWGEELMRTPLGAFYNHSETPNIEKIRKDSRFFIVTLRDIWPGEELTCRYTFYEI